MESAAPDAASLNRALVKQLKDMGVIQSASVEAAFRAVPRHLFVPSAPLDKVYRDEVIVTKQSQTGAPISSCEQPAIVAVMLEQLGLEPGQNVLEIGAGTGHVAALLAHIVGKAGRVTTMDIQPDVAEAAREHLAGAGLSEVNVVCSDGGFGYAEAAPYDRIILTVGSSDIAPAWQEQLRVGGRLVLPLYLMPGVQESVAFGKTATSLESLSLQPCGFMPLQGSFAAERPHEVQLGTEPGLTFSLDHEGTVDAQAVYALLTGPSRDLGTDITVTARELVSGLGPWITLNESHSCGLGARKSWLSGDRVPLVLGQGDQFGSTGGLIDGTERLALLARPPDRPLPEKLPAKEPPIPLRVISYGPDDALAERLIQQVQAWDKARRPMIDQARITAYPRGANLSPSAGDYVLVKPSVQFVVRWEASG